MERTKRLEIRVSPQELETLHRRASDTWRSLSDFVRDIALDRPLAVQTFNHLDPSDLAQVKQVGYLLNQIAAALNARRDDSGTIVQLEVALQDIRTLIRRELAKMPPIE